jgi:hypothetical protein
MTPAAAATSVAGGAYGISASGKVAILPVAGVGPVPSVTLPPNGGSVSAEQALNTGVPPFVSADALRARTAGIAAGPSAVVGSTAGVVNASALGLIGVSAASGSCSATQKGATGSASVDNLSVAGKPVLAPINPRPNTTIPLQVATVTLNEQVKPKTGHGITVNAVHVKFNAIAAGVDVVIAQSRCEVNA